MKKIINILLSLLLITGTSGLLQAGTPGFEFLRTPVGARASAMGGAFVAVPGDVHDIFYNPSGLALVRQRVGAFSYLNNVLDFQSGFIAVAQPLPGLGTVGAGINYFNYGEFTKSDANGNELGTFGAGNLAVNISYANSLFSRTNAPEPDAAVLNNIHYGVSLKFIYSKIDQYSSTAVAADFGLTYETPIQGLVLGGGIFNVGKSFSPFIHTKETLPLNYRFGFSKILAHLPLQISVEGYKYRGEDFGFAFGGEFTITNNFFLRFGYNSIGKNQKIGISNDKFAGISFGTGFLWKDYHLDYGFTSSGAIGNLNRLTVVKNF
ncbi:hypothetical protein BMS3Abin05_01909 [bacterium BMS3Abin05]|nr:hypothetical protein BMS3Abin05_01909 [bacterium BMS3Abin05]GBE27212.1 hypothetical protein BMS3Bbin03_01136 [bacterium BMS3Bbin03]HDK36272.1 PorV/PorQ family protein [Bacteroidota bacterium]HDZ10627.1 PorV/PorQ family protein [Bacteroidota bacterium]